MPECLCRMKSAAESEEDEEETIEEAKDGWTRSSEKTKEVALITID